MNDEISKDSPIEDWSLSRVIRFLEDDTDLDCCYDRIITNLYKQERKIIKKDLALNEVGGILCGVRDNCNSDVLVNVELMGEIIDKALDGCDEINPALELMYVTLKDRNVITVECLSIATKALKQYVNAPNFQIAKSALIEIQKVQKCQPIEE